MFGRPDDECEWCGGRLELVRTDPDGVRVESCTACSSMRFAAFGHAESRIRDLGKAAKEEAAIRQDTGGSWVI